MILAAGCGAPDQADEAPAAVRALVAVRDVPALQRTELVRIPPAQQRVLLARLATDRGTAEADIECWTDPWRVICTNRKIGVTCTVEHGGTNPECHNEDGD